MRTSTNSIRNTSSKSGNNQQQKFFSNNLAILTGNLGKGAAFFGANDSAASFRMATKSKFAKNMSNGVPWSLSGNWPRKWLRNAPKADLSGSMATCITATAETMAGTRPKLLRPGSSTWSARSKLPMGRSPQTGYAPPFLHLPHRNSCSGIWFKEETNDKEISPETPKAANKRQPKRKRLLTSGGPDGI